MEGPQFSTRAESELHRAWGASLIGMTVMPEAKLAREAEICYALVALPTDYDCWKPHPAHARPGQAHRGDPREREGRHPERARAHPPHDPAARRPGGEGRARASRRSRSRSGRTRRALPVPVREKLRPLLGKYLGLSWSTEQRWSRARARPPRARRRWPRPRARPQRGEVLDEARQLGPARRVVGRAQDGRRVDRRHHERRERARARAVRAARVTLNAAPEERLRSGGAEAHHRRAAARPPAPPRARGGRRRSRAASGFWWMRRFPRGSHLKCFTTFVT